MTHAVYKKEIFAEWIKSDAGFFLFFSSGHDDEEECRDLDKTESDTQSIHFLILHSKHSGVHSL